MLSIRVALRSRKLPGLALVGIALAAAGCGSSADGSGGSGKPKVLTTFTVTADIVRNVAGDRVDVASITKIGSEIHGYDPTPGDIKRAADADLVLDNGLDLERWFDQFIDRTGAKRVTLSDGVEPIPIAGGGEYAGKPNPHAWMSISDGKIYVENARKALTDLDPEGAATYAANAKAYTAELDEVATFVRTEIDKLPENERALVSCEGAFSYLARDLGLQEGFLWPVNADDQGTPRQIASTIEFVRERKVPAVFCESTVSDRPQQQVAKESGARLGGKLYVDSLSEADGPVPTYLDLLRKDAETIVAGLTGGRT